MSTKQNQEIKRKYNISWERVARVNYLPIFKISDQCGPKHTKDTGNVEQNIKAKPAPAKRKQPQARWMSN